MSEISDGCERELERYEAILRTIEDAVFIVDEAREIAYANESALAPADTTLEDLRGTPISDLTDRMVADGDTGRFEAALESAFADEGADPIRIELELDPATGSRVAEYSLSPRYDDEGRVRSVVVVARDVTERKRREERLRDLTEEYGTIFEHTEDAIFLIGVAHPGDDLAFRVERLNPAYEAITGLTDGRARGKTPRDRLGDELGAEIEANCRRCVDAGEPITYEEELSVPDGRVVAQTNLAPVVVDGEVTRIVGISRDVTERVEHEARLKRRDEELRRLHEATRELLGADSPKRAAKIASDAAADILELPMNGIHFHDEDESGLVPVAVSDDTRGLLEEVPVIDEGVAWEAFEHGESRIHDDIRDAEEVYNPDSPLRSEIHLPLGDYGVFIASSPDVGAFDERDIELARTLAANAEAALDRLNREQELETREEELVRKNERLDEFASVVSHDLRGPLNVAEGRVELARADRDSEHLEAAATAHERMDALIEDLLTLARQGETVEDVESIRLAEVLERCWGTVPTAEATRVIESDRTIRGDRTRVQQLIENLIRNAIEHGGGDVTVTAGALENGFYVADDGPGIPEGERDDVFETGYSTAEDGNGFGLSIVKGVADAHGWEVAVTESESGGARFEVTGVATGGE